jgi:hypothetical protein
MTGRAGLALAVAAMAIALPLPATAEQIESAYTTFDSDKCPHEEGTEEEDYGTWTCPGYDGIDIVLSAGDQRMYVTYGDWDGDIASSETFPGVNDVYEGTVEWRIARRADGKAHPFATILRWNLVAGDDKPNDKGLITPTGRVLVVTRLGPGGVCHVGHVDARAHPDANVIARQIADERARDFHCGTEKAAYWPE